jgi:hypothetical protein
MIIMIAVPASLAVVFAAFLIWKAAHASGKVDGCYLIYEEWTRYTAKNVLMGHRDWLPDVEYGRFIEPETAVEQAHTRGCELKEYPW